PVYGRQLRCLDTHACLAPVREWLVASHPAEGILGAVLAVPTCGPTWAARRVELRTRGPVVVDRAADIRIPGRSVRSGPGTISRELLSHVVGQRYPQCIEENLVAKIRHSVREGGNDGGENDCDLHGRNASTKAQRHACARDAGSHSIDSCRMK